MEGNGDCLFAAILCQLNLGKQKYSACHLRWHILKRMVLHKEWVFHTSAVEYLRDTYGAPAKGRAAKNSLGGPFSFRSYILAMCQEDRWGDLLMVTAMSIISGLRISCLSPDSLRYPLHIRHPGPLKEADLVLVHNSDDTLGHFSGTGNKLIIKWGNTKQNCKNLRQE